MNTVIYSEFSIWDLVLFMASSLRFILQTVMKA